MPFRSVLVWGIAIAAITAILFRPRKWPEAVWACLGALLLIVSGLIPVSSAALAVGKGLDVYLFLTGMMLASELAGQEGVFDWLAGLAVKASHASRLRLFSLIYLVGTLVTVFLSNDATAVVLTPAVYAAVRRARAKPLPYLLICAFIANAASFVLPISNPANLVVYGKTLPPLWPWLRTFFLPSVCSIVLTWVALWWTQRSEITGVIEDGHAPAVLTKEGRLAAWAIAGTGAILIAASALGLDLGLPTSLAALAAVLFVTRGQPSKIRPIIKGVSWSVLPLVAGLFVLVEALNRAGALDVVSAALHWSAGLPPMAGAVASAFGIAGLSNLMNNLPSGLLAGGALQTIQAAPWIRDGLLIGVDLGPNLSVTGSLATVLWLIVLRREGQQITAWQFLKIGFVVMTPALLVSSLVMALLSK